MLPRVPASEITILGGGPAGLAVAHYAHAAGLPFRLLERSTELGGLCRTLRYAGHGYDTGAHRFHDRDAEITSDVRALLGDELCSVSAPSRIYYRGRFLEFPPSPLGWIRSAGLVEGVRVGYELVRGRMAPRPERTFEDVVANRYGFRLGRPLLAEYSEKLWGLPARELEPDVATRRLAGMGLAALAIEIFRPRARSAHLDGAFLYPREGYGEICRGLAAGLPAERVETGREVVAIEVVDGAIREIRCGQGEPVRPTGPVVSTLPLTLLARLLGDALPPEARAAAAALRFRHVRLIFLRLGVASVSPNATIYLPAPRFAASRVTEPRNRSPRLAPPGETALVAEVPCSDGEPLAALDDRALAHRVTAELAEVGLIAAASVREWRVHRLADAYPVYSLGYHARVEEVLRGLAGIDGLTPLGRGGRFFYSHLHDQLRAAKDYVRSLSRSAAASGAGAERPSPSIAAHILRSARKL